MTNLTLEALREELAPIKGCLDRIDVHVRGLLIMGRSLETLRHDLRQIRAAVNDLAVLQMTSGEAAAIHFDLDKNTTRLDELEARIAAIETARED
jgi:hypothetical protein